MRDHLEFGRREAVQLDSLQNADAGEKSFKCTCGRDVDCKVAYGIEILGEQG
ncbi:hypothetical protein BT69DRAFT_1277675 [Atractiella rhizophila]|nr:hypothetical protein BT69DRAFT_1277675 [Atractiella rhizophila]